MNTKTQRIEAFIALGKKVEEVLASEELALLAQQGKNFNGWFTEKHIRIAFEGVVALLEENKLRQWAAQYTEPTQPKTVGVVMAGNIPMAGMHDMICVLVSGHQLMAKLSSQDPFLLKQVAHWLIKIEPSFKEAITLVERLKGMDAIIATGSDNTARYFEYYFRKYPHIIRKNRVSFAVLNGEETDAEIDALADDIFLHYGLGCRNVSKLWLPKGFSPNKLLARWKEKIEEAKMHHKYMNNYEYNRSIYLINSVPHLDGGGLMMKEDEQLVSPVSVLFYEYYSNLEKLKSKLDAISEKVQCIVAKKGVIENSVTMGQAQFPLIDDYADRVDTMAFLSEI